MKQGPLQLVAKPTLRAKRTQGPLSVSPRAVTSKNQCSKQQLGIGRDYFRRGVEGRNFKEGIYFIIHIKFFVVWDLRAMAGRFSLSSRFMNRVLTHARNWVPTRELEIHRVDLNKISVDILWGRHNKRLLSTSGSLLMCRFPWCFPC